MPYKVVQESGQYCVVKESDGSKMGCHATSEEATAQIRALYAKEGMFQQCAFEPFATLAGTLSGAPFKILPIGKFYRGDRAIDITADDLMGIERNVKNGLPRFRIPINPDHKDDVGKIGTVHEVEFRKDGEDGPGLYATKYDLTDRGKKLVSEDGYDAPSAELVWTKNDGQKYQDPFTGEYHDNVLVGVAFTPRPFFGHNNVSLYSANPGALMKETDTFAQFKEWFTELFKEHKEEMKEVPTPEKAEDNKESNMADTTVITDTFDAKAKIDELTAQLGKQAEEFKAAQEASLAEKKRADEFAVQLSNERKTRRLSELRQVGDTFVALPIKSDEFAEKFYALEQVNADLAKWFTDKFAQFNTDMATGDLFSQVSRRDARKAEVETIETFAVKIMAEETKQDKSKYSYTEALIEAGKRRPQLAEKHLFSSKSAE